MNDYTLAGYEQEEEDDDPTGILAEADRIYNMGPQTYYPGQSVANTNPYLDAGIQGNIDAANQAAGYIPGMMAGAQAGLSGVQGFAQGGGAQVGSQYTDMMSAGDISAIDSSFDLNPYLDSMADATGAAIGRNWQQNVIPGLNSSALGAGQMGSSRHGIAQGLAGAQQGAQLNETLAGLYGTGWESAMQNQTARRGQTLDALGQERARGTGAALANATNETNAWGHVSGATNALANMGSVTANIGQMAGNAAIQGGNIYRDIAQQQIDAERDRWAFEQNQPWDQLTKYANIINGTGTTSGSSAGGQASYTNPWLSAVSGAGSGWEAASMIGDWYNG